MLSGAAFGFAIVTVIVTGVVLFIGTRRILLSPYPGTPLLAARDGWRELTALLRAFPRVGLFIVMAKLLQILAYSARSLTLTHSPAAWIATGIAVDFLFTMTWAGIALRIDLAMLAPEAADTERRLRIRRAVAYALIFWAATIVLNLAGILVYAKLASNGRVVMGAVLTIMPYLLLILSALTRPAIAVAVPRPFRECLRILRENWFGIAVTLALAALPVGLVFLGVGLVRQTLHMPTVVALLLEIPIGVLSAICYAAFEASIAATYRWIM